MRQASSLRAVHEIVGSLYSSLEEEEKEHDEEQGEEEIEEEEKRKREDGADIPLCAAVDCVVELVEPFVASIHQQYASKEASSLLIIATLFHRSCLCPAGSTGPILDSSAEGVCQSVSYPYHCVAIETESCSHCSLLALLGQPLVSCDLRRETAAADLVRATESILVSSCVGEGRKRGTNSDCSPPTERSGAVPLWLPAAAGVGGGGVEEKGGRRGALSVCAHCVCGYVN